MSPTTREGKQAPPSAPYAAPRRAGVLVLGGARLVGGLPAVLSRKLGLDWQNPRERSVFFASWSIGGSLVMAAWKIGAATLAPALLFGLANAAFSLGLAVAKWLAVGVHRRTDRDDPGDQNRQRRLYRAAGATLIGLAAIYIFSCTTMLTGDQPTQQYDTITAITIATLAFTELGLALHGVITARRSADMVVETIKLSNLAGALVLLVLTQTALLSLGHESGISHSTGLAGIVLGSLAAVIGLHMLVRRVSGAVAAVRTTGA